MSVIDILFRVDSICKKYDKYDIEKQRDLNANGGDPFALLYAAVERDLEAALHVRFFFSISPFFPLAPWSILDVKISEKNEA